VLKDVKTVIDFNREKAEKPFVYPLRLSVGMKL
jgi:hypothetical protein